MSKPFAEYRQADTKIKALNAELSKLIIKKLGSAQRDAVQIVKASGLSNRQFAIKIGISPPYLGDILAGNRGMNDNLIEKFESAITRKTP